MRRSGLRPPGVCPWLAVWCEAAVGLLTFHLVFYPSRKWRTGVRDCRYRTVESSLLLCQFCCVYLEAPSLGARVLIINHHTASIDHYKMSFFLNVNFGLKTYFL